MAKVDFSTLMLQLHLLSEIQFFEKGSVKVFMFFASQMGLWGGVATEEGVGKVALDLRRRRWGDRGALMPNKVCPLLCLGCQHH